MQVFDLAPSKKHCSVFEAQKIYKAPKNYIAPKEQDVHESGIKGAPSIATIKIMHTVLYLMM